MQTLAVPVPETLQATYLIPLQAPMTKAAARRRITKAVGTRFTGPGMRAASGQETQSD